MLNYYHLLKISDLCNDAEVITMTYRRAIAEKAHGNESDDGFRERICGVTEAYLVLSDMLLKNRYDHALSEGTPLDDDLSQHIAAKRSEAEAFVLARLGARGSRLPESYRSKRRHHKSLIGIAIGVIVLLVTVFGQCHSPVDDLGRFQAPPSWEKVSVSNAEIQVPPGMELSREDGSLAGEGLILHVEYFAHGDVPAHDQSPRITEQDCKEAESAMRTYMPEIGVTNFSKPELRGVRRSEQRPRAPKQCHLRGRKFACTICLHLPQRHAGGVSHHCSGRRHVLPSEYPQRYCPNFPMEVV